MPSAAEGSRIFSLTLLLLVVCFGVTACTAPERHQDRADYLEHLVTNFDAPSIGQVLCEYDFGEAGALTHLHHAIALEGADVVGPLEAHLKDLGYSVTATSEAMAARRDDSTVAVRLVERPGTDPDFEQQLESRGCSIPENGVVVATITEHTPARAFEGE